MLYRVNASIAVIPVCLLILLALPAGAAQTLATGGGGLDGLGGSVDASAGTSGTSAEFVVSVSGSGDEAWASTSENPCTWEVLDFETAWRQIVIELDLSPADAPPPRTAASEPPWLVIHCPVPWIASTLANLLQLSVDPPPPSLMESIARGLLTLPLPQPLFSPGEGTPQITGVETWFWVPDLYTAPITVAGCTGPADYACASITATFDHLEANMGDGSGTFACAGVVGYDPTLPWSEQSGRPHCGHVYTQASGTEAYPVTVTAAWTLEWTCTWDRNLDGVRESSCGGGPLDIAGRSAGAITLEVRELQARATR